MQQIAADEGNILRVELAVKHPECWVIEVSEEAEVGL